MLRARYAFMQRKKRLVSIESANQLFCVVTTSLLPGELQLPQGLLWRQKPLGEEKLPDRPWTVNRFLHRQKTYSLLHVKNDMKYSKMIETFPTHESPFSPPSRSSTPADDVLTYWTKPPWLRARSARRRLASLSRSARGYCM